MLINLRNSYNIDGFTKEQNKNIEQYVLDVSKDRKCIVFFMVGSEVKECINTLIEKKSKNYYITVESKIPKTYYVELIPKVNNKELCLKIDTPIEEIENYFSNVYYTNNKNVIFETSEKTLNLFDTIFNNFYGKLYPNAVSKNFIKKRKEYDHNYIQYKFYGSILFEINKSIEENKIRIKQK